MRKLEEAEELRIFISKLARVAVNEDFIITRGLLEKRQLTIPLKRIQAIRISENLIRQPFGYCTFFIVSAGGTIENTESSRVTLLPVVKKTRIKEMLRPCLEGYMLIDKRNPAPKRALKRYLFRGWLVVTPLVIVSIFLWKSWGLLALILLPLSALWSYIKYKDAGWWIEDNVLTLTYRTLIKHTVFLKKNRIQSLSMQEGFLQRKEELSTVEATGGTVVDLEQKDVLSIYNWFSRSH